MVWLHHNWAVYWLYRDRLRWCVLSLPLSPALLMEWSAPYLGHHRSGGAERAETTYALPSETGMYPDTNETPNGVITDPTTRNTNTGFKAGARRKFWGFNLLWFCRVILLLSGLRIESYTQVVVSKDCVELGEKRAIQFFVWDMKGCHQGSLGGHDTNDPLPQDPPQQGWPYRETMAGNTSFMRGPFSTAACDQDRPELKQAAGNVMRKGNGELWG